MFNLIILGSIFILVLFGVGESVLKYFHLKKIYVLITLALMMIGLDIPNLEIEEYILSVSGFILPAVLSLILLFKTKKFSRLLVGILLCTFCLIIYRILEIEANPQFLLQPYMFFSLLLGCFLVIFTSSLPTTIISMFIGLNLGEFIFFFSRKSEEICYLGNEELLTVVLCGFIGALIIRFAILKLFNKQKENVSVISNK